MREHAFVLGRAGCWRGTAILALLLGAASASGQVNGNSLALRSSGAANGTSWTLSTDGYVGTYIQLSQAAPVTFTVNASGTTSSGLAPDMTLAIANQTQSFSVTSTSLSNYNYTTPTMPAGTYFVRVQLDNQNATQTPALTVGSLQATGAGVTVLNSATDANALNAAQSYINNFRQGAMDVTFQWPNNVPLPAGTPVQVKLVQNAFSLGAAVYDTAGGSFYNTYPFMTATANSTGNGALAYKYQQFLVNNFNMTEPTNAGKWSSNEGTKGSVNMTSSDQLAEFAAAHNMRFRQHNLIWQSQQPSWVNTLFTNNDIAGINSAVTNRIKYYVSNNNTQSGPLQNKPRALGYDNIDVLNEGWHPSTGDNYIGKLGNGGVANIYAQMQSAVAAAGGHASLFVNEYNVLQYSSNPQTSQSDPYANWYRSEIEQINNAGYGKVVTGAGAQLYASTTAISPSTVQQAMQNLSIPGIPIVLTEFGIATGTSATTAANDLQQAFTMFYGNPNATGFQFWEQWLLEMQASSWGVNEEGGALIDASGNPTALFTNTLLPMLAADHYVLPGNITSQNLTVDANGKINFSGTYGTYDLTMGGKDYLITSSAANPSFTLTVAPEPASLALLGFGAVVLWTRRHGRKSWTTGFFARIP